MINTTYPGLVEYSFTIMYLEIKLPSRTKGRSFWCLNTSEIVLIFLWFDEFRREMMEQQKTATINTTPNIQEKRISRRPKVLQLMGTALKK